MATGIKAFEISAAKRLNAEISHRRGVRRKGQVFADRYHARAIRSVRDIRHSLAYVLNNFRHHRLSGPTLFDGKLDWFSSAVFFPGWKERTTPQIHVPANYDPPKVSLPRTWLLAHGWKRAEPISAWDVPGTPRATRTGAPEP